MPRFFRCLLSSLSPVSSLSNFLLAIFTKYFDKIRSIFYADMAMLLIIIPYLIISYCLLLVLSLRIICYTKRIHLIHAYFFIFSSFRTITRNCPRRNGSKNASEKMPLFLLLRFYFPLPRTVFLTIDKIVTFGLTPVRWQTITLARRRATEGRIDRRDVSSRSRRKSKSPCRCNSMTLRRLVLRESSRLSRERPIESSS